MAKQQQELKIKFQWRRAKFTCQLALASGANKFSFMLGIILTEKCDPKNDQHHQPALNPKYQSCSI